MKKRKVIYTCITGAYEEINEPLVINKQWDYICFTDSDIKSNHWTVRKIPDDCLYEIDEDTGEKIKLSIIKTARKIKINSHKYLSDYDISIWIDANLELKSDPEFILDYYGKKDYSLASHDSADCIYTELDNVLKWKKDDESTISKIRKKYEDENIPKKIGMVQSGVLIRNHRNPKVCMINDEWWNMVREYSHRDQLSFNYVLWNNKKLEDVVHLFSSRIFINEFNYYFHKVWPKKIPSTLNENYGKVKNYINGEIVFDYAELTDYDILKYKKILIENLMKQVGETQMRQYEYEYIMNFIGNKNFLVFGTGHDNTYWRFCNRSGKTVFLENDDRWINDNQKDIVKVDYTCSIVDSEKILQEIKNGEYSNAKMILPDEIRETKWDVIFVDSPTGYDNSCPGRIQSIFTALELANEDTNIFVHDCNREVENKYTAELFETEVQLDKLRHLKRSKLKYTDV